MRPRTTPVCANGAAASPMQRICAQFSLQAVTITGIQLEFGANHLCRPAIHVNFETVVQDRMVEKVFDDSRCRFRHKMKSEKEKGKLHEFCMDFSAPNLSENHTKMAPYVPQNDGRKIHAKSMQNPCQNPCKIHAKIHAKIRKHPRKIHAKFMPQPVRPAKQFTRNMLQWEN